MKNNVKIFIPIILAIFIGSLTFAFAQTGGKSNAPGERRGGGPGGPGFGPGGGIPPHVLDQLNLTDAQKTQISALQSAARTASQTYFDTIRTADSQLQTLVEGGNFTEAAARQILATKTQAQIELEVIRLKTDAAIYALLTADQKAQLATLKQQPPNFPHGGRPDMPPPPQD